MGGASEQVTGGVVTRTAGGTGGVPGRADPRFVGVEESAMAGSELGQGGAVGAGKGKLFPLDKGRGGLEDGEGTALPSRQGEGGIGGQGLVQAG